MRSPPPGTEALGGPQRTRPPRTRVGVDLTFDDTASRSGGDVPGMSIFEERSIYTQTRLDELRARLSKAPQVEVLSNFTIFSAGSYGRHEASKYSDIDLFFLWEGRRDEHFEPKTSEL